MYYIPNSTAIDAAAGGQGPGTVVLPQIATTDPKQIKQYAVELGKTMKKLFDQFEEIGQAGKQLRDAWSAGSASAGALDKLTRSVESFQKIVKALDQAIAQIDSAAKLIELIQKGYQAVVSVANPVVAALLSNPFTQAAARALARFVTVGLKSFLTFIRSALDTLGLVRIAAVLASILKVAAEIKKILSNKGGSTTPPTTTPPTTPTTTPPVTTPTTPVPGTTAARAVRVGAPA